MINCADIRDRMIACISMRIRIDMSVRIIVTVGIVGRMNDRRIVRNSALCRYLIRRIDRLPIYVITWHTMRIRCVIAFSNMMFMYMCHICRLCIRVHGLSSVCVCVRDCAKSVPARFVSFVRISVVLFAVELAVTLLIVRAIEMSIVILACPVI